MGAKLSGPGSKAGTIEQNAEINVTPFVDIMLVLLIIFMVAAPMATVSIKLDLPPAIPPPPGTVQKDPIYIEIMEGDVLYLSSKQTTLASLPADLCAALGGGNPGCKQERVFVKAQAEVTYSQFMEVVNTLQANGFFKVGLLNENIE